MAETLSPLTKQRGPFSPSSPYFLGSNDDNFERAQARAARAAAIRRKSVAAGGPPRFSSDDSCLDQQQILELLQNCIKLASENKITQKNTWSLNLIDHLREVIKVEEENDAETNFQKASCTLEAGVKIYSMRVDSVHSEAYKVLGGINRVGQGEEQDIAAEDATDVNNQEERRSKRDEEKKLSPLSTLESSFDTLNVKKFDVAFAVDPLYHQTSAQFDEGGAKGLLLNNLGVYGNCQVLFDSLEVPGKCTPPSNENDCPATIDLSFAREYIELMVLQMPKQDEISPSLRQIVSQFDDNSRRSFEATSSGESSCAQVDETCEDNFEVGGDAAENIGSWDMDQDDQVSVVDDGNYDGGSLLPDPQEECNSFTYNQCESDDKFEQVDDYLLLSLGFPSKRNAWAGPDHWKYRKSKDSENLDKENAPALKEKRAKSRKELDIDFTKAMEMDKSTIFIPPKNPKLILLPANRAPCTTRLPEDCHYQPESLVKLFLLPEVLCLGRRRQKVSDEFIQNQGQEGPIPSWDDENGFDGTCDDNGFEDAYGNIEDSANLVSQPRQVNKIDVNYDKKSKQVDVQVLKETLWGNIQKMDAAPLQKAPEEKISFKQMLAIFPSDCRAAACIEDISPHLCFICLLHLANEHSLRIVGNANLDDLSIYTCNS